MSEVRVLRERGKWIAAVAVLVTSLAWLALIDLVLLLRSSTVELSAALVTGKALVRTALLLVRHGWPILPAALLVLVLLAVLASRLGTGASREEEVCHD